LGTGELRCWGWNAAGQLGDGTTVDRALPVTVAGLPATSTVAGGGFHTCAIGQDKRVFCWGSNDSGQLGDGTIVNRSYPSQVTGVQL